MAIDKKRKDELVDEYTELLQRSSAIFLTRYGGMTVKEMEALRLKIGDVNGQINVCLLYTSPSPRDGLLSRMPSSA